MLEPTKIAWIRVVLYGASLMFSSIVVGLVIHKVDVDVRSVHICWFDQDRKPLPCDVAGGVGAASLAASVLMIVIDLLFNVKGTGSNVVRKTILVLVIILSSVLALIWLLCSGFLMIKWNMVKDLVAPITIPSSIAGPAQGVIALGFLSMFLWIAVIVLAAVSVYASRKSVVHL